MGSACAGIDWHCPAAPSSNKRCNSEVRAAGKAALILGLRLCSRATEAAPLSPAFCAEDKKRMEATLILSGSYQYPGKKPKAWAARTAISPPFYCGVIYGFEFAET